MQRQYTPSPIMAPTVAWVTRDKDRQLFHLLALGNHGVAYCGQTEQPWPYALPSGVRPAQASAMCDACIRALTDPPMATATAPLTWAPGAPPWSAGRDVNRWLAEQRERPRTPGPVPLHIVSDARPPLWRRLLERIEAVRWW